MKKRTREGFALCGGRNRVFREGEEASGLFSASLQFDVRLSYKFSGAALGLVSWDSL